ncbi:MAG: MFS transporter [Phycisphaerae bacterium]
MMAANLSPDKSTPDASNSGRPQVRFPGRFSGMTRALRSRNYRLFFSGQLLSVIGTSMTQIAVGWLIYHLTGSAFDLGFAAFMGWLVFFFTTPLAGVWADRLDLRHLLLATQTSAMLQSVTLAILTFDGHINFPWLVCMSMLQGLVNAFDIPSRQAFVVQMVASREDLSNAIALNSSMMNFSRPVGAALAGIIIAAFGAGICFSLDALSYAAVIAALLAMRIANHAPRGRQPTVWSQWRAGLVYVRQSPPIRMILLLVATVALLGSPYVSLMPFYVKALFNGDVVMLGLLVAASGFGALAGALTLATRRTVHGLEIQVGIGATVFGLALVAFAWSHFIFLGIPILLGAGFGMITTFAGSNTLLQTIVPDENRGRMMSFYAMANMGMTPIGCLLLGWLPGVFNRSLDLWGQTTVGCLFLRWMPGAALGAAVTITLGGLCCAVGGVWFSLRRGVFKTG